MTELALLLDARIGTLENDLKELEDRMKGQGSEVHLLDQAQDRNRLPSVGLALQYSAETARFEIDLLKSIRVELIRPNDGRKAKRAAAVASKFERN